MINRLFVGALLVTGLAACEPRHPDLELSDHHPASSDAEASANIPAPSALRPELTTALPRFQGPRVFRPRLLNSPQGVQRQSQVAPAQPSMRGSHAGQEKMAAPGGEMAMPPMITPPPEATAETAPRVSPDAAPSMRGSHSGQKM